MVPPPVPNPPESGPIPVEESLTVDSFLQSLGLEKYIPDFKEDEIDMTRLREMHEIDLKDLLIPMGTRKKILQAIACLPKQ